jgi:hypothetical protein
VNPFFSSTSCTADRGHIQGAVWSYALALTTGLSWAARSRESGNCGESERIATASQRSTPTSFPPTHHSTWFCSPKLFPFAPNSSRWLCTVCTDSHSTIISVVYYGKSNLAAGERCRSARHSFRSRRPGSGPLLTRSV